MKYVYVFVVLFIALGSQYVALGYNFFFESFIATEENKIEFMGSVPGGQLGADIASGDFNGDGIDDIALGAPFVSSDDKEWNGEVYIIFGKESFPEIVDFSQLTPDLVVQGYTSGDQLGTTLTTGDFNNDGIDDFVIGAFNAKSNDKRPGKVYIYYGDSTWGSQKRSLLLGKANVLLVGDNTGDNFGLSLTTQDVDGDTVDDLLIGAPSASSPGVDNSGVVYLYTGSDQGISTLFDVAIYGNQPEERFGSDLGAGDIDGDGNVDVIVGAYYSEVGDVEQAGRVYFYTDMGISHSVISTPSFSIEGEANKEWFGFAVDANDVDGDQIYDVAISSFPYKGDRSGSKVSVYYGGEVFDEFADLIIDDPMNSSMIGARVLLEDFDRDGNAEIIIGAPGIGGYANDDAGDVYVVHSGEIYNHSRFSVKDQQVTSIINGQNADDWFGYSVNVLDINGDGFEDLAVGSRYADSGQSVNDGSVVVLLGDGTPFGDEKQVFDSEGEYVTRGEFISVVVERFHLKREKNEYINKCYEHIDFCLFNFMTMSSYNIQLEPDVILYPDMPLDHEYYEDVTIGTMLGLINGYLSDEASPFFPDNPISRIQALKIVLGAADAVPPKYRFELVDVLGSIDQLRSQFSYFTDVDPNISYMWWYPRYVNFAVENNIINKGELFRPDETITKSELDDIIGRTIIYKNSKYEEIKSSGDSENETDGGGSKS
ncbi:MAG: hypothetical protein GWP15_03205 [Nitrospirae bacterium]|nr:hypothetical protein [Nitrospirota bacterium]